MKSVVAKHDAKLDLVLEREIDVPVSLVWKVWTTPEHLKHWFCPKPWQTTQCAIDLRPGGLFTSVMRGPEGQEFTNSGCSKGFPCRRFTGSLMSIKGLSCQKLGRRMRRV